MSGVYVAVQRNAPEYKKDPDRAPSVAIPVTLIMLLSATLGLLVFVTIYAVTKKTPCPVPPPCPSSFLTDKEFEAVDQAQRTIDAFAKKVDSLPRGVQVDGACPNGICENPFTQKPILSQTPQNQILRKDFDSAEMQNYSARRKANEEVTKVLYDTRDRDRSAFSKKGLF